ncbi:MAG: NAD-dependent epimerase/dehydratase family protein, partial [Acidimicrobiales bacterium]
ANASGTVSVLEAARRHGVGHVVVASSLSVYGANPTPEARGADPTTAELLRGIEAGHRGLRPRLPALLRLGVLAFRFFNVFGPLRGAGHAYAAVIPAFVSAALAGEPLSVHGDG